MYSIVYISSTVYSYYTCCMDLGYTAIGITHIREAMYSREMLLPTLGSENVLHSLTTLPAHQLLLLNTVMSS